MDGVLIDSEPLWRIAEQQVLARVGLHLDETMCARTMGYRIDEVVAYWYRRQPWTGPSQETVAAQIVEQVRQLLLSTGRAMPGVGQALQLLSGHGLVLALASSSAPVLIETVLERLAIGRFFTLTCSGAEVARGKPAPDLFLHTAERLGMAPAACLVIEGSEAGVTAARAAGMRVIAVPAAEHRHLPSITAADRVLGSLAELTLAELTLAELTLAELTLAELTLSKPVPRER